MAFFVYICYNILYMRKDEDIPVKYYVFVKLSRTSYDGASIYKEFDNKDEAERFLKDLNSASTKNEEFDESKDYDYYLQSSETFKEKFPYFFEKWVASFDKEEDIWFGTDMKYEGAIPEQLMMNDDDYIRSVDFQTIIEGKSVFKDGWDE